MTGPRVTVISKIYPNMRSIILLLIAQQLYNHIELACIRQKTPIISFNPLGILNSIFLNHVCDYIIYPK